MNIFIIQTLIMIVLAFVIFYLIIYNNTLKLEKRIAKYSIDSIKDDSISLFDLISNEYKKAVDKLTKILNKSVVLKKYSSKYNKYITYENDKDTCAMDFVSNKFYICLLFVLIITFARIIEGVLPSFLDILVSALLGFFSIDIYFKFYDYIKKRQIEQDLLNAIIIMNNAFRSGRSTMQAIEIVAHELKGPISQEFRKMHLEISYGLSLDVVFDRFSKRVESEEVTLLDYYRYDFPLMERTACEIFYRLVDAVLYLHSNSIQFHSKKLVQIKKQGIFLLFLVFKKVFMLVDFLL